MIRNVLVVCVGNICRSPMAAALLAEGLGPQSGVQVASAGLGALVGRPAEHWPQQLMQEAGLDISAHRARQLDVATIRAADLVLVMEAGHKRAVEAQDPAARGKVYRLCEWQPEQDVRDPYREPREVYEACLASIRLGVADWLGRLKA